MDLIEIIPLLVFAGFAVFIFYIFLSKAYIKFFKGEIIITPNSESFNYDQPITAKIRIYTQREFAINQILASLVYQELVRHGKSSSYQDRHNQEIKLPSPKRAMAHSKYDFNFEIKLDNPELAIQQLKADNQLLQFFVNIFEKKSRFLIRVYMDAEGLDFSQERIISIIKPEKPIAVSDNTEIIENKALTE